MLSLLSALAGALCVEAAAGEVANRRFDITAQSLGTALTTLADQAGIEILFPEGAVEGLTAPALSGSYTPHEALESLLAGTGLRYTFTAEDSVIVRTAEAKNPPPAPKTPEAPPANPEEDAGTLPEITVTASPIDDTSYNPPNATTATKTDTPIMETPYSITVVPRQVLRDQQAFRLDKALRNVSGVIARPSTDPVFGIGDVFNLRGFATEFAIYRDGARQPGRFNGPEETAHLERVEVLKGPASLLYGRIEPGGLINQVSKQPLAEPYYELSQLFGSFDLYRTTLDAGGPITEDEALKYRFNLAYEEANSFVDLIENDRVFVAPVLRWDLSPATQLTLEFYYRNAFDPANPGIPFIGNRPAPVPRGTFLGEPDEGTQTEQIYGGFHWSHAFNDDWSLSHRFFAGHIDQPEFLDTSSSSDGLNGTRFTRFGTTNGPFLNVDSYYTTLNLTGHFNTWGIDHTLLMGGDYTREFIRFGPLGFFDFGEIDIFQPVRGAPRTLISTFEALDVPEAYGFYVQDQAKLPFDLHLLAGFRYDRARVSSDSTDIPADGSPAFVSSQETDEDAVTPRAGLLWRPLPELSLYGSYTENFGANNGLTTDGLALPPETAQQYEVGVKTELFDGRLNGTLALFDLTKQNVASADPSNPLFTVVTGEVRHRGVEVDVAGEIVPGWQLIGSYAYLDSEITKDSQQEIDPDTGEVIGVNDGNTGNRLGGTPRHAASLWSTYDLEEGLLKGLKLGAGMVARSQNFADAETNDLRLPGYVTAGLLLGYERTIGSSKVSFQFNVDNLLDKTYFESSGANVTAYYGAPRTFLGEVRVEF